MLSHLLGNITTHNFKRTIGAQTAMSCIFIKLNQKSLKTVHLIVISIALLILKGDVFNNNHNNNSNNNKIIIIIIMFLDIYDFVNHHKHMERMSVDLLYFRYNLTYVVEFI